MGIKKHAGGIDLNIDEIVLRSGNRFNEEQLRQAVAQELSRRISKDGFPHHNGVHIPEIHLKASAGAGVHEIAQQVAGHVHSGSNQTGGDNHGN